MSRTHFFIQFQYNTASTNNIKWQTEPFTAKTLKQLKEKPRVVIDKLSLAHKHHSINADRDVPDVYNVANFLEITSTEDIYVNTSEKDSIYKNNTEKNIEDELSKMFFENAEDKIVLKDVKEINVKKSSHRTRKKKKGRYNLQERLKYLFGSEEEEEDDVEFQKPKADKIKMENRRHTLPVSINVHEGMLKPLKVSQKRKSETDVSIPYKVQKTKNLTTALTRVLDIQYIRCSQLMIPTVYSEMARVSYSDYELESALVIKKPKLHKSENVKAVFAFVDLTSEDFEDDTSMYGELQIEIVKEETATALQSTERANVPQNILRSMPSLSPLSPTEPTRTEAVLPQKTQAYHFEKIQTSSSQRPPVEQVVIQKNPQVASSSLKPPHLSSIEQKQQYPNLEIILNFDKADERVVKPQMRPNSDRILSPPQPLTSPVHGNMSHAQRQKAMELKFKASSGFQQQVQNQLGGSVAVQPPPPENQQIPPPQQPLNGLRRLNQSLSTVIHWQGSNQTPQNQQNGVFVNQQLHPPRQQWNQQTSTSAQAQLYPPTLLRILQQPQAPLEYQLISNSACAEKIFHHLDKMLQWKFFAGEFFEKSKTLFTPSELRECCGKFCAFSNQVLPIFSRNLVTELAGIDVQDFDIGKILTSISANLTQKNYPINICGICNFISLMMEPCAGQCNTPFLRKFCASIKMVMERIAQKFKAPLFENAQLVQLKTQIQQYLHIQKWISAKLHEQSQSNVQSTAKVTKRRPSQKKNVQNGSIAQQNLVRNDSLTSNVNSVGRPNTQRTIFSPPPPPPYPNKQTSSLDSMLKSQVDSRRSSFDSQILNSHRNNVLPSETTHKNSVISNSTVVESTQTRNNIPQNSTTLPTEMSRNQVQKTSNSVQNTNNSVIRENNVPEAQRPRSLDSVQTPEECSRQIVENSSNVPSSNSTESENEVSSAVKDSTESEKPNDDVIDLTWIDECDEKIIFEEVLECKVFPFKLEGYDEYDVKNESSEREVISPTDSGLGSPVAQGDDSFKCLCGNKAIYVCACKSSMYCSSECQVKDWIYHQKLCHKMKS